MEESQLKIPDMNMNGIALCSAAHHLATSVVGAGIRIRHTRTAGSPCCCCTRPSLTAAVASSVAGEPEEKVRV